LSYIKEIPEGAYQESEEVYDCAQSRVWESEVNYYTNSGENIYHYKWAAP
jgi:hypothetical protein